MNNVVISGSGLYTPEQAVSNLELVEAFNAYVDNFNQQHASDIARGEVTALAPSCADFIEKASGIKSRYVIEKSGILDPDVMQPVLTERPDDSLSLQAEIALHAAKEAMTQANKTANDIDMVIVACSNMQRPYPAISIEIQKALGISGFAFDMNVACSSATFALVTAQNYIKAQSAKCVLILNPEICTAQVNFKDRDSHFIFGDVATAMIIESKETVTSNMAYEVMDAKLFTDFSNNIRTNTGYLNRLTPGAETLPDKLFYQNGRKVFKEVISSVFSLLDELLTRNNISNDELKRLWLHQANANMNRLIASKLLGKEFNEDDAPMILDRYANTASAGSVIAFHLYQQGINSGDQALLCSFGAGYSIGALLLKKI